MKDESQIARALRDAGMGLLPGKEMADILTAGGIEPGAAGSGTRTSCKTS
jgi:hypothetical protein